MTPTRVKLMTNMGDILVELREDMPVTVENFLKLVREKLYDNTKLHRIIKNFIIQGGDPEGTGLGGPGYTIEDEFVPPNENKRGTIAMANAGPSTGGSQFFINLVDNTPLDDKHPVFGRCVEGMEIVDKIANLEVNEISVPDHDVRVITATVIDAGVPSPEEPSTASNDSEPKA